MHPDYPTHTNEMWDGGAYSFEDENIFKKLWYDPSYKVHDLCESVNSGKQSGSLVWTESGDRLLKVIGNGVVKDGYNMFLAPGQAQGRRTDVHVAVYIESMSSFKAQTMVMKVQFFKYIIKYIVRNSRTFISNILFIQDFEVDMYLAMGWFDRRLAHNCTHPILVTSKVILHFWTYFIFFFFLASILFLLIKWLQLIADRIWHPDLYFVNSKFAYLQEVTTPNLMVIVYPDGLIFKSMRIDVTLSCMMDLKLFPIDNQECPLTIQSYAYIEQIVNLTWHVDPPNFPVGSNEEIKLNDMTITKTRFEKCAGPYPMFRGSADWSCIRAFIVMKRLVLFHIIQTYIPTGMLVSISWMSFWLDPRASPARISLTITSLLTLTTMSNGARQDLPQVSYIKALDIWLTFSQALIFLVLLEYSFVSFYITKRVFNCSHRACYTQPKTANNNQKHSDEEKLHNGDDLLESYPFAVGYFILSFIRSFFILCIMYQFLLCYEFIIILISSCIHMLSSCTTYLTKQLQQNDSPPSILRENGKGAHADSCVGQCAFSFIEQIRSQLGDAKTASLLQLNYNEFLTSFSNTTFFENFCNYYDHMEAIKMHCFSVYHSFQHCAAKCESGYLHQLLMRSSEIIDHYCVYNYEAIRTKFPCLDKIQTNTDCIKMCTIHQGAVTSLMNNFRHLALSGDTTKAEEYLAESCEYVTCTLHCDVPAIAHHCDFSTANLVIDLTRRSFGSMEKMALDTNAVTKWPKVCSDIKTYRLPSPATPPQEISVLAQSEGHNNGKGSYIISKGLR
uniref:Cation transporter family protein n=1 Tax=Heterorhabditis bacteriophora TaxID=37862 RepID=A0A1I7XM05_HETBA